MFQLRTCLDPCECHHCTLYYSTTLVDVSFSTAILTAFIRPVYFVPAQPCSIVFNNFKYDSISFDSLVPKCPNCVPKCFFHPIHGCNNGGGECSIPYIDPAPLLPIPPYFLFKGFPMMRGWYHDKFGDIRKEFVL